jgi:hypothetical protein
MKKTALTLALAMLGTGCIFTDESQPGGIIFYWTFSSDQYGDIGDWSSGESGAVVCATAGVDVVRVWLGGDSQDFDCADSLNDVAGIWYQGLPPGRYDYELWGYRGADVVYDTTGTVDVHDGQDREALVRLGARYWDVRMPVATPGCVAGDYFSFEVETSDGLELVYSSGQGPNPPITVPCATSFEFVVPSLASGAYRTEWALYDVNDVLVTRSCLVPFTQASDTSTVTSTIPVDALTCP